MTVTIQDCQISCGKVMRAFMYVCMTVYILYVCMYVWMDLRARNNNPDKSVVICPKTLHALVELLGKVRGTTSNTHHCENKNYYGHDRTH